MICRCTGTDPSAFLARHSFSIIPIKGKSARTHAALVVAPLSTQTEEAAVLQVVFDDDISDRVEDKLDVLGVGSAGEVGVDLFGVLPLVQILKLTLDVRSCIFTGRNKASRFCSHDKKLSDKSICCKVFQAISAWNSSKPLDVPGQIARHESFIHRASHHKQLPSVILQHSQSNASWLPKLLPPESNPLTARAGSAKSIFSLPMARRRERHRHTHGDESSSTETAKVNKLTEQQQLDLSRRLLSIIPQPPPSKPPPPPPVSRACAFRAHSHKTQVPALEIVGDYGMKHRTSLSGFGNIVHQVCLEPTLGALGFTHFIYRCSHKHTSTHASDSHLENRLRDEDRLTDKPVEFVLIVLGLSILSLITIVGNVLVILSIKVNRNLQTVNNYFLFSLACADLFIGVFSMNLYTVYIAIGSWPLGPLVCDLWLALDYVVSNASVMNLLIISFDRFFCVTKPLSYPVKRTHKMAGIMIAGAWILSFILWAPAILFWQFITGTRTVPEGECYIQFFSNAVVTFGTAIAAFYLPVVTMSILYWQICKASRSRISNRGKSRAPRVNYDGGHSRIAAERDRRSFQGGEEMVSRKQSASEATTAGDDQESENDSISGSGFASSHQRDDDAVSISTNGEIRRRHNQPTALATGSWVRFSCFKTSTPANQQNISKSNDGGVQELTNGKERSSLVSQKIQIKHRQKRKSLSSRERKVTRTIMAILVAFAATWTPYNVMVLINTFCSACVPNNVWIFGYWLCYINSTVNPACYALCNVTFKNTFKQLLTCKYRNIQATRKHDEFQAFICDAHALTDVQCLELMHLPDHPVDPIVADVAGAERQRLELVQTLSDPPKSNSSKFFKYCAIRPKLESVICLQRLRLSILNEGISWTNA
ncbi:hypothetical protein DNTS_001802 [Danionella cerebrum]|uniref:Muscarinic acetylcholine receptor n=1 Tax=Danionella cerebrum TaxID=2873325 RepID=A0A553MNT3_9TELE|nr:hypothetical protein DNTS_001802 [Danionella translucida]